MPTDWEIHPTHPVHHIPYQVAQFWEKGVRDRVAARGSRNKKVPEVGRVSRELRDTAKRTPALKGWVRLLEEPVRRFVAERYYGNKESPSDEEDDMDSEDEEIVFVGRQGGMIEGKKAWKKATRQAARGKGSQTEQESGLVIDSLGDGESGAFR
jgi:hypothetical protein